MRKGFSVKDVTLIGREKHQLNDNWECFRIDAINYPIIKYRMGLKNEDGSWSDTELHDTFNADEATIYSVAQSKDK